MIGPQIQPGDQLIGNSSRWSTFFCKRFLAFQSQFQFRSNNRKIHFMKLFLRHYRWILHCWMHWQNTVHFLELHCYDLIRALYTAWAISTLSSDMKTMIRKLWYEIYDMKTMIWKLWYGNYDMKTMILKQWYDIYKRHWNKYYISFDMNFL